jgi:hypothetical protein
MYMQNSRIWKKIQNLKHLWSQMFWISDVQSVYECYLKLSLTCDDFFPERMYHVGDHICPVLILRRQSSMLALEYVMSYLDLNLDSPSHL